MLLSQKFGSVWKRRNSITLFVCLSITLPSLSLATYSSAHVNQGLSQPSIPEISNVIAQSSQREITVRNETGSDLTEIYISSSNNTDWGNNLLDEGDWVAPNAEITIQYPSSQGTCEYDMQAVFKDNKIFENYRVQLCDIRSYTFQD